ncbi:MAG: J domain-containing protein [Actinomycetota bacterium]|nr:J domain-containing protein [Actinomycetota bacterium]
MDPYEALGLERSADPAEIRRAFRARVCQLHPDLGAPGDTADDLRVVLEAYARLHGCPPETTVSAKRPAAPANLCFYRRQRLIPAVWTALGRALRRYHRPARVQ